MLIRKYSASWIFHFSEIKNELEFGIGGVSYKIEHVGSTAVPNLDSKPIIDIDIIYSQQNDFEKIKLELEKLGYYHNGNQGITDRDVFKRQGLLMNKILDAIPHHLYVCPVDSKALERHLLSRNYLRNNDLARAEYQRMKYEMAEKSNQDRKVYAFLKEKFVNGFIDSIVEKEKQMFQKN